MPGETVIHRFPVLLFGSNLEYNRIAVRIPGRKGGVREEDAGAPFGIISVPLQDNAFDQATLPEAEVLVIKNGS